MKHKILLIFTGILISSIIITVDSASATTHRYMDVHTIIMELDGPDATFTVEYELDVIAQLYVLFLGSKSIEPAISEMFSDFNDSQVISIRDNHAVVVAKNIAHKDPDQMGEFYFYDSHNFGITVDKLQLKFPSGITREFYGVSSTPNTFYEIP